MDNNNGPQPQPQNQMQPPMQPPANYNLPPKKSNAGLIAGIIGGVVLLVGVIVAIVLALTMFSGPSKADYKQVQDHLSDMKITYSKISLSSFDSSGEKMKQAAEEFKKEFEELGKMKGITGDKEVKEAYDKINDKMEKFMDSFDVAVEITDKITPALKIDRSSSIAYSAQHKEQARKLEAIIGDLKNEANKKYVKDMVKHYNDLAKAAEKWEKATEAKDYSSSASSDYFKLFSDARKITSEWEKNLKQYGKDVDVKDDVNKLIKLINERLKK